MDNTPTRNRNKAGCCGRPETGLKMHRAGGEGGERKEKKRKARKPGQAVPQRWGKQGSEHGAEPRASPRRSWERAGGS